MELKDIRELIEMVNSSELAYFELKMDGNYIKMDKSLTRNLVDSSNGENSTTTQASYKNNYSGEVASGNIVKDSKEDIESVLIKEDEDLLIVKSPMVGTFYRCQSQGSEPFVSEGKRVSKGDILCIVEAMKLMNEIECEYDGEIANVLIEDGQMVEYGQPMFKLRRC